MLARDALRSSAFLCAIYVTPAIAIDPPINAALVGRWDGYDGYYAQVEAEGHYAYLGAAIDDSPGQVQIIDIADPADPQLETTYFLSPRNQFRNTDDLTVVDGILYIALENQGTDLVEIVDVRDPSSPTFLTTARHTGIVAGHNVAYDDGFLYLADSRTPNVLIFDVRTLDPDSPPPPITSACWIIENIGPDFAHDLTIHNGRLYVAAWNGGLHAYDVSDVANCPPTFLASVPGNSTHSIAINDDGTYIVTAEERVSGGLTLYEIDDTGDALTITPTDVYVLGQESFSVHNPMIVGNRLYASWWQAGMYVLDINAVTSEFEFVARFDTTEADANGGGLGAFGVYPGLGENTILVTDFEEGLFIIDVDLCNTDLNGDGAVNASDLAILLGSWGPCEGCPADFNGDNVVDATDLAQLLGSWGPCE